MEGRFHTGILGIAQCSEEASRPGSEDRDSSRKSCTQVIRSRSDELDLIATELGTVPEMAAERVSLPWRSCSLLEKELSSVRESRE